MKKNFKYGFSLAEAMVMLTIVAVIMAVSVPLIAKKAQVDTRTLLAHSTYELDGNNFTSTSGAFGNSNRFGIGIKKAIAKLHLRDSAGVGNNNVPVANRVIFRADVQDNASYQDANANNINYYGFEVFADGSTNVRSCVPDYARSDLNNIVANGSAAADGYLLATGQCISVQFANNAGAILYQNYCPTSVNNILVGSVIVPVSHNTRFEIVSANTIDANLSNANNPTLFFIPCATLPVR